MTEHERKDRKDRLEVSLVWVLSGLLTIFAWGYVDLNKKKLDRAVYEENQKLINRIADDLSAIRGVIDQHAFQTYSPESERYRHR